MKKTPFIFYIFLYLFIWVGLTLLLHSKSSISPDTVENIMWGMNPSLIYDKHPGLGALFLKPFILLFSPLLADLLAVSVCILLTWFFLYRISRIYFEIKEALFVTLSCVLSFFYMGEFFIQYNQNIILLPFWCSSTYFFIKAISSNKTIYWLLTAALVALGVYAKFQIAILLIAMFLYLLFNYQRKYTKNIILSMVVGILFLLPGFIALYKLDFLTLRYASERIQEPDSGVLFNILNGLFDSVFQLLNFSIGIVILVYLMVKKKISRYKENFSPKQKVIIYVGVIPYIVFILMEMLYGQLPTEWLVCTSSLLFVGAYVLLKFKLKDINLYSVVALGISINLAFFVVFNLHSFMDSDIEHNNIGNSVAVAADSIIKNNSLPYPEYASGSWNYSLYLPVFMKNHPKYIRDWYKFDAEGIMIMVFPGCQGVDTKSAGYKVLYKQCVKVKLIDKVKTQRKPFLFYLVKLKDKE